jgi:hypothetical protein
VLVPHGVVVLAEVHRHLGHLGVGTVELAFGPWHLGLGTDVIRALEGGLVTHCHGMDFVELDDHHDRRDDENMLVEDFCGKKNAKSVDLSGAVLKMKLWKKCS